ncbi:hypothetical protein BDR03DRAFT_880767, partial [Suillus americanus]
RKTTYYIAQGRAIRRLVVLYASLEDLVSENDHRYEDQSEDAATLAYVGCQYSPISFLNLSYTQARLSAMWLHQTLAGAAVAARKLQKGADAARGDNTSCLKDMVATWVNQEFRPSPLIKPDDKRSRRFGNNVCGKLLCPAEWDWDQTSVKTGIRNRMSEYIVSENSWPLFLYENYIANRDNLKEGLFKSKLLVLAFKAIFTSPSSAKEVEGDGDGADILENDRRTQWKSDQAKRQVHFALSSISSWRTIDGDFDYEGFWNNVVDFFEDVPGPVTKCRVDKLLEWWTRKIFGMSHREDLTPEIVLQMFVNTLSEQRKALEDAAFDLD